ncbi:hypothetical protein RIR_jg41398.t1 [Rhizophagus irregularis DAOM 181602=DAOM 197198]|uniref:Uncharacterized protein n=1 Tax=Rhizophagus irregularis (strain DAOM 197198w) TaxID=1432141 RepID=A0A015ICD6_RHIIW|nr:hypothetical protein RirG_231010 [Rhizophagus irregularis DAOM 197198w]GBC25575.1 hypothetical protein RIR_jg41398.t1 [Rhizophagus irregularis DAOM 181602=DAOM 197198]
MPVRQPKPQFQSIPNPIPILCIYLHFYALRQRFTSNYKLQSLESKFEPKVKVQVKIPSVILPGLEEV